MRLSKPQIIGLSIVGVALLASANSKNLLTSPNPLLSRNNSNFVDKSNAPDANLFIVSSEDESKKAINEINRYRKENGKSPINYSTKAYKLAVARAKDMNQYNYFAYTNPQTKLCTDNMKFEYGFQSKEYLSDSIYKYVPVGVNIGIAGTKTLSDATREWIDYLKNQKKEFDSNFLFNYHLAGAVGCDGNKCVFLGLNAEGYGKGCITKKG
ncbi:MAG: CAP domain-containing protein [Pseudanabaena sp. CAN_BIN31]|jgi:hypothetical protein|nr:CAP domain-containing protein [Pseudanabaena sp. CAN_BIN31]